MNAETEQAIRTTRDVIYYGVLLGSIIIGSVFGATASIAFCITIITAEYLIR